MIGVLIVFYDDLQNIDRLAGSLLKQTFKDYSIYIIDNQPELGHSKKFQQKIPGVQEIPSQGNIGFGKANNLLATKAIQDGCDWLLVLNPDMELSENTLEVLLNTCHGDSKIGICSCVILFGLNKKDDNEIQLFGGRANFKTQKKDLLFSNQKIREVKLPHYLKVDFVNGGSTFISKEVIGKCGFFEEKYFMYNEEIDLSYRVIKAGYDVVVTSETRIWHHHDWSSQNSLGHQTMQYYMMRNKFLYHKKFHHYAIFFYDILKSVILFPFILRWLMKTDDARLVKFYYLGILNGILGETGKRNKDF